MFIPVMTAGPWRYGEPAEAPLPGLLGACHPWLLPNLKQRDTQSKFVRQDDRRPSKMITVTPI